MKLRQDQLGDHLQRQLASAYLVSGDEPLLVMEACDAIRQAARQQGFDERHLFHAEAGFDWNQVREEANALSLFASRRLIEIRIPNAKPSDKGAALEAIAPALTGDTLLLIVCPRLDPRVQKTKWVKAIDAVGVSLPIWPIERHQYPGWLKRRLQQAGCQIQPAALALLAQQTEGNLLAAVQEIEKLRMLDVSEITEEIAQKVVGDQARYDAFGLADACLLGQVSDSVRMLNHLRAEGVDAILILGAVLRKLRQLLALHGLSGQALSAALKKQNIWPKQQAPIKSALQRLQPSDLQQAIYIAQQADAAVKGSGDDPWLLLTDLTLLIAGQPLASTQKLEAH